MVMGEVTGSTLVNLLMGECESSQSPLKGHATKGKMTVVQSVEAVVALRIEWLTL